MKTQKVKKLSKESERTIALVMTRMRFQIPMVLLGQTLTELMLSQAYLA